MESQGSTGNELRTIEQRLRRLEDIDEIKKLKARYCEACDGGWDGRASHNTEKIVGLFAEDGVWDGGVYGGARGEPPSGITTSIIPSLPSPSIC